MHFCQCSNQRKTYWSMINVTSLEDVSVEPINAELNRISHYKPKLIDAYLKFAKSSQKNYEHLENLHSILNELSKPNCLILINNFIGLNIGNLVSVPIMLRRINYAILNILNNKFLRRPKYWEKDLIWFPHGMSSFISNISVEVERGNWEQLDKIEYPCPLSRFYTGITPYNHPNSGHCVGLNLDKFVVAEKPWQCQVDISLFMPSYMLRLGKQTQIFTRSESNYKMAIKNMVPSSLTPKISVIVNKNHIWYNGPDVAYMWLSGTETNYYRDQYLHENIILIQLKKLFC